MSDKANDCIKTLVIVTHVSLDIHWLKEGLTHELACLGFIWVTLLINALCADPLILKSLIPPEKKQLVLVFGQKNKTKTAWCLNK